MLNKLLVTILLALLIHAPSVSAEAAITEVAKCQSDTPVTVEIKDGTLITVPGTPEVSKRPCATTQSPGEPPRNCCRKKGKCYCPCR